MFYTYWPLFGLIMLAGLGGVIRIRRVRGRLPRLAWSPRAGSMLPWATAVVLLVTPVAVSDFDYRYLLPSSRSPAWPRAWRSPRPGALQAEQVLKQQDDLTSQVPGQVG